MQVKAVIVEDSRLARNELKELLKPFKEIEIVGEAENVDIAFSLINEKEPDLLFLDINMPEKNGFELLEMLDSVPLTIFTTAYDEYAIKSFDYNAFDYLLKPIKNERLAKAIYRVLEQKADSAISATPKKEIDSQIFLKEGEKCWLVKIHEICMFETEGNYTRVYFGHEKPLIYKSLNHIESKLPPDNFFRINRQQLVNINDVKNVLPWFNGKLKLTLKNSIEVEVSRRQSTLFKEWFSI